MSNFDNDDYKTVFNNENSEENVKKGKNYKREKTVFCWTSTNWWGKK